MASLAISIAKNEFIVGGKYRLMRKIGSGSFGDIYLGINISNGEVRSVTCRVARPTAAGPFQLGRPCARFPSPIGSPVSLEGVRRVRVTLTGPDDGG